MLSAVGTQTGCVLSAHSLPSSRAGEAGVQAAPVNTGWKGARGEAQARACEEDLQSRWDFDGESSGRLCEGTPWANAAGSVRVCGHGQGRAGRLGLERGYGRPSWGLSGPQFGDVA